MVQGDNEIEHWAKMGQCATAFVAKFLKNSSNVPCYIFEK